VRIREAVVVMRERAEAIERAPGTVVLDELRMAVDGDTPLMLLQGVDGSAEDALDTLKAMARLWGLPPGMLPTLVEVFVLGSLVGRAS
jgi:hypothetical protein